MANIGTLTVRLVATATQFEKTLQNAQKMMTSTTIRMQKQADNTQKLGTAMTLGISAPLAGAGVAALKMAGDMEQTRIAFTNMLGSAEKSQQFLDQLSQFAEKTPFEYTDLIQQARQLMAFGFAAKDIIPMLTAIGDSVAAMGGNADMLDRVTKALSQMRAKQKVSAEEMLQLAEAGIPAYQYLAQAIGKSVPETMKLAEKGLIPANVAINSILNAMERNFGGMMAQQSQTMLGSWSNLMDVIGRLGRTLGDAINRSLGLTQKIQQLTDIVQKTADALQKMNPALRNTIIYLGLAAIITGPLLYGLGLMSKAMAVASTGAALLTGVVKRAVFAFTAWRTGAATLGESLSFVAGGPAGLIIGAIIGIITAVVLLIKYWDYVKAAGLAAWRTIAAGALYAAGAIVKVVGYIISVVSFIVPAWRGAAQSVLNAGSSLFSAAKGQWNMAKASWASMKSIAANKKAQEAMAKTVATNAKNTSNLAKSALDAAKSQDDMAKSAKKAGKQAADNIQSFDEVHQIQEEIANSAADISTPAVPAIGDVAAPDLGGGANFGNVPDTSAIESAANNVKSIFGSIGKFFGDLWDSISYKWSTGIQSLGQLFSPLANFLKTTWADLQTTSASVWGEISNFAATTWGNMQTTARTVFGDISQFVKTTWTDLQTTGGNIWGEITNFFGTTWSNLKQTGSDIWGSLGQFFNTTWTNAQTTGHNVWGELSQYFATTWSNTQTTASNIWGTTKDIITGKVDLRTGVRTIWDDISAYFGTTWGNTQLTASNIWGQISTFFGTTWGNTKLTASNIWGSITNFLGTTWTNAQTTGHNIWTEIGNFLSTTWGNAETTGSDIFSTIGTFISDTWTNSQTTTSNVWSDIGGFLDRTWNNAKTTGGSIWGEIYRTIFNSNSNMQTDIPRIWNSISTTLGKVWGGISTTAGSIWRGIANTVIGFVNGIIDAINGMIWALNRIHFDIPDWVPVLGGKSFGFNLSTIGRIPYLAQGGIVTKPTLAMIGEAGPEAVVPLSRAQSSDDIAQAVYQAIMDAFRITSATQSASSDREIVLKIDNTTLARLQLPAIIKEGQRQGLNLVVRPQGV